MIKHKGIKKTDTTYNKNDNQSIKLMYIKFYEY